MKQYKYDVNIEDTFLGTEQYRKKINIKKSIVKIILEKYIENIII